MPKTSDFIKFLTSVLLQVTEPTEMKLDDVLKQNV